MQCITHTQWCYFQIINLREVYIYRKYYAFNLSWIRTFPFRDYYKKLSYPQRKCASNVAILYGADGISI